MSYEARPSHDAAMERPVVGPEGMPPSDDRGRGLLRPGAASVPAGAEQPVGQEPYIARLEFEPPHEEPLPRHNSRQMMRWDPPHRVSYDDRYNDRFNDRYDGYWDDRYERRPQSRRSYDYPPSRRMYSDDRQRDLRLRRNVSIRDTPSKSRGGNVPPTPPSSAPRRRPEWHDESEDESEDEPPKPPNRRRGGAAGRGSPPPEEIMRIPFTMWMNSSAKNHFVAAIGEFVGTTMFLFFAFAGTQVANIGAGSGSNTTTNADTGFSPIVLLYIAISFGFSLMVNVWIFFRVSGGLFNPAVTLGMTMVKAITYARAIVLLSMQISGAIFASYLVSVLFPSPFNVRTTVSEGTSIVQGIFIEAVLSAELVFTIFMLAKEKHKATFMAPIGIGLALFVAELVGVFYTGGSLNPARSFGPCVVTGIWDKEHWIYWLGPAIGAVAAVLFYKFIKVLEYEVANPGQDEASEEEAAEAATTPKKETV